MYTMAYSDIRNSAQNSWNSKAKCLEYYLGLFTACSCVPKSVSKLNTHVYVQCWHPSHIVVQGLHACGSVKRPYLTMTYTHLQRLNDCRRLKQFLSWQVDHTRALHVNPCSSFHIWSCATAQRSCKT